MRLCQHTYISVAAPNLTKNDVDTIVTAARTFNFDNAISGLLLWNGVNFLQTIEGSDTIVDDLMGRIYTDARHTGVVTLVRKDIDARAFQHWSMGYYPTTTVPPGASGPRAWNGFDIAVLPRSVPEHLTDMYRSFATLGPRMRRFTRAARHCPPAGREFPPAMRRSAAPRSPRASPPSVPDRRSCSPMTGSSHPDTRRS